MNANALFCEQVQIVPAFLPKDLSGGVNAGDFVSLANFERVTVLMVKAAGTAGDDPTITIREAKDVAGTDVQALSVVTDVHVKQGASLAAIGQFTRITQAASANYTDADAAEAEAIWAVDIMAEDLSEDFTAIQANIADVGNNAQLGMVLYLLWPPRYARDGLPVSAIA